MVLGTVALASCHALQLLRVTSLYNLYQISTQNLSFKLAKGHSKERGVDHTNNPLVIFRGF